MKKTTSLKSTKRRKSIASLFLALVMLFSINYTPISLVASNIDWSKSGSAYVSSTTGSYYTDSSSTETNVSSATYPEGLEEYFSESSVNFNILEYYQSRYNDIFEMCANYFLSQISDSSYNATTTTVTSGDDPSTTDGSVSYADGYKQYLSYIGYDSLGEYYEANLTDTYDDFITYFEYFVTNGVEFSVIGTDSTITYTIPALFGTDNTIYDYYQSNIYLALANYLHTSNPLTATTYDNISDSISDQDGLTSDTTDFYADSVQYNRVKTYIDDYIVETCTIYSYDEVQDRYVAGIVADDAPTTIYYYYEDSSYEQISVPSYSFYTTYFTYDGSTSYSHKVIYCFSDTATSLSELEGYVSTTYSSVLSAVSTFITYSNVSTLESSPLSYYKLQPGDEGYIGDDYPLYWMYNSIPFSTTNSQYDIYLVSDSTDAEFLATVDSLQYFTVITEEEWEADYYTLDADDNTIINPDRFYIEIPYFGASDIANEYYYSYLFKTYLYGSSFSLDDEYFQNFLDLVLDTYGNSRLYLKLKSNTTKIVYIDNYGYKDTTSSYEDIASEFTGINTTYSYTVQNIDSSEEDFDWNDYYEIDSDNFSSYTSFSGSYTVYFKKVKVSYTTTTATYATDTEYETLSTPNIDFVTTEVPTDEYETETDGSKSIYVLENGSNLVASTSDTPATATIYVNETQVTVTIISEDTLNAIRNEYVSVPSSITETYSLDSTDLSELDITSLSFYYKHKTETVNQIYVVDSTSTASENEVYKNLYYEVLSSDDYTDEYYNYLIIDSTDENYNENFTLYYKYAYDFSPTNEDGDYADYFVQNKITGYNAIYIVDDSITSSEKSTYRSLFITPISSDDFSEDEDYYVALSDADVTKYTGDALSSTLYYKYSKSNKSEKAIYLYSSESSDTYLTFYDTDDDFLATDYELIQSSDPNYVAGLELYYKKIRTSTETTEAPVTSYYYYQGSSTISVSANSYYVLSFYMYTNGTLYGYASGSNEATAVGNVSGSVYFVDTSGVIDDIAVENVSTNGEWQQFYVYFKTDAYEASTLQLELYLGNKDSIVGENFTVESPENYTVKTVSGVVLFDNIVLTLINETDFNNKTIDGNSVNYLDTHTDYTVEVAEDASNNNETTTYYIMAVTESEDTISYYIYTDEDMTTEATEINGSSDFVVSAGTGDNSGKVVLTVTTGEEDNTTDTEYVATAITHTMTENTIGSETVSQYGEDQYGNAIYLTVTDNSYKNDSIISNWSTYFDFDSEDYSSNFTATDDTYSSLQQEIFAGYFTDENENAIKYYDFNDSYLWHYYISRDDSGSGNYNKFLSYKNAYLNGKVDVSVIKESTIDKTTEDEDDEDEDEDEDTGVATVSSTFNSDNSVLKIENNSGIWSLGIVSTTFTIKQNEYYKITVWVYSPDEDATATIKAESVLYTSETSEVGTLLSTSATVDANISAYSTEPTNEYGWIPVSFYIQGNAYQDQEMYLVLLADTKSTVYFDNITIEKTTSGTYSTISSDSDDTTYCLALSTSDSVLEKGVTNGYFNFVNVTDNYEDVDYTIPRTAQSWTVQDGSSEYAIAGVIPTSNDYVYSSYDPTGTSTYKTNFYTKYSIKGDLNNETEYPFSTSSSTDAKTNIFGIYLPSTATDSVTGTTASILNNYSIYSTSMSLSANSIYEIKFSFYAGYSFSGTMIANLYYGSSASSSSSILASFSEVYTSGSDDGEWVTYTFYIQTSLSSMSATLEIGVENAVGTCFFKNVSCVSSSKYSTVDEARDGLISSDDNSTSTTTNLYNKESLKYYRFVNMDDSHLSLHSSEVDSVSGTYESNEYTTSLVTTSSYTVGKSGVVVASYYETEKSIDYFTVTISSTTYYIKQVEDEETDDLEYKMFSDSVFTNEVEDIDGNSYRLEASASGKTITVYVGESETEYTSTAVNKTEYTYYFTDDVTIGDIIIPASELTNNISQNVLILANSYTTDYTDYSPVYTKTLSTSSYYVLKIYVKTSEFISLNDEDECGLNITVDAVSAGWTNICTANVSSADENGFVCYQVLISTNTSSVTSLGVQFSLGSEDSTCYGYAIIAGVELETISSETLFEEYSGQFTDDDTTIQRFYGTTSSDDTSSSDEDEDDAETSWATFFYVFSSLLLGIVLIIAIIAAIIRRHPIRINRKVKVEDNIILTDVKNPTKKKSTGKQKNKTDAKAESSTKNAEGISLATDEAQENANETTEETAENGETDATGETASSETETQYATSSENSKTKTENSKPKTGTAKKSSKKKPDDDIFPDEGF